MKRSTAILAALGLIGGLLATPAMAYDQPAVNLGLTSFLDGGPPAGPGCYFTQYVMYYTADELTNSKGNALGPPKPEITAMVSLSQFLYQSNKAVLLGGKWGLDVIVPVVSLSADYAVANAGPADNGTGLGDVLIGPYLQWDPIMGDNGPVLMQRVELQVVLPTGKHSVNKELNPGSKFISINPYWAGTYFINPRTTTSLRLHYLWNAANSDPNRNFAPAKESQAGSAIHFNLAAAYEVKPKQLRLGINSYYLKQLGVTTIDGADVANSEEVVLGIGPGAVYHCSPEQHVFVNIYTELSAENRPKGMRLNLRYVHHF